jgi:hypothetical protein
MDPIATDQNSLKWLESTGGPLVLIEQAFLPYWHGYEPINTGVTDYERACKIADYLGTIKVGPGYGVVLGEEPFSTTWWQPDENRAGLLVRWVYADNEAEVLEAVRSVSTNKWLTMDIEIEMGAGDLVLFDSASAGSAIDSSITIRLTPGTYRAQTLHYNPNENISLILHQFILKKSP